MAAVGEVPANSGGGPPGQRPAGLRGLLLPGLAVAGLVVGTTAGAAGVVGSGGSPKVAKARGVAVVARDCPDGAAALTLHRGDRVLVVGRDATGSWLQIRDPSAPATRVWVGAGVVTGDRDLKSVPVANCVDALAVQSEKDAPATIGSSTTTTTLVTAATSSTSSTAPPAGVTTVPRPSSSSTSSTTGPTSSTTAPDTTPPVLGAPQASPAEIWEEYPAGGGKCTSQTTSIVSVTVDDASPIASVTMAWQVGKSSGSKAMTGGRTRSATLGSFPYPQSGIPEAGADIAIAITATDVHGNKSTTNRTVRLHSASECVG